MTSLYEWFKERWQASQAVMGMAPSHRTPPPWGRPGVGLTDTDYLLLLMSTRSWP